MLVEFIADIKRLKVVQLDDLAAKYKIKVTVRFFIFLPQVLLSSFFVAFVRLCVFVWIFAFMFLLRVFVFFITSLFA